MIVNTECVLCGAKYKCNGDSKLFDWQIEHARANHKTEYLKLELEIKALKKLEQEIKERNKIFIEDGYFNLIIFG